MVSTEHDAKTWGIRSLTTGNAYLWARNQDFAELMLAGTGRLDAYEVVQLVDERLVVHEIRPSASPVPEFAQQPIAEPLGEDDEVLRMLLCYRDLAYGLKIPPMTATAAELRERAEAELRQNPLRWHWYRVRIWWYHWRRGLVSSTAREKD